MKGKKRINMSNMIFWTYVYQTGESTKVHYLSKRKWRRFIHKYKTKTNRDKNFGVNGVFLLVKKQYYFPRIDTTRSIFTKRWIGRPIL